VTKAFICFAILLCLVTASFACFQTEQPPVAVRTISLNGRVTFDDDWGGPKQGKMTFTLHRAITFDRSEARKRGAYAKPTLKSASSDSDGLFSFGEVDPGRYWIVLGSTLSDSIPVEVASPGTGIPHQRLRVRYSADGCRDVMVEDGK